MEMHPSNQKTMEARLFHLLNRLFCRLLKEMYRIRLSFTEQEAPLAKPKTLSRGNPVDFVDCSIKVCPIICPRKT